MAYFSPPSFLYENPCRIDSVRYTERKPRQKGFSAMLVGYLRVSSESDRQSTDLQWDALLAAVRRYLWRIGFFHLRS